MWTIFQYAFTWTEVLHRIIEMPVFKVILHLKSLLTSVALNGDT